MAGYIHCCPLLHVWLVVFVTRMPFGGTINITRSACRTDSIQLFSTSQIHCVNTTLSLYKKITMVIMWDMREPVPEVKYGNGYKDKFILDKSRNIWILDVHDFDEAIYSVRCPVGNTTKKHEVKLEVLVEPETRCKPKIVRGVNTLTTYLEPDGCGLPAASAYWLHQPGISISDNVIKLQEGQAVGTVYACIESPSFRCSKNYKLSDYCTVFKEESKVQTTLSEISRVTIANLVVTALLDGLLVIMIIFFYRRLMGMLKNSAKRNHLPECRFSKTERIISFIAGTEPFIADFKYESADNRNKLDTDEAFPLIEDRMPDYPPPSQEAEKAILMPDAMESDNSTNSQESVRDNDMGTTITKLPSSTTEETKKELQELRDASLCKICYEKTMCIVLMPCNHIATCINCSDTLTQCPVCRALIEKRMNIRFN